MTVNLQETLMNFIRNMCWGDNIFFQLLPILPRRYAFWSDWGLTPYIGRIGMDGANRTKIVTDGLGWPNGLTLDYVMDRLWWCDAHLDFIE